MNYDDVVDGSIKIEENVFYVDDLADNEEIAERAFDIISAKLDGPSSLGTCLNLTIELKAIPSSCFLISGNVKIVYAYIQFHRQKILIKNPIIVGYDLRLEFNSDLPTMEIDFACSGAESQYV